jgi:phosphoglycerol geranylgeranyltransferase
MASLAGQRDEVDMLITACGNVSHTKMSLADLARRFEAFAATVSMGGRALFGLDTNPVPAEWTHITKVDPESAKQLPLLYPLYLSHTSAVSVGGSQDVTDQNTEETFELLTDAAVTAFQEPSAAAHVTEETRDLAAFTAIPEVLNGDSEALVGTLGRGIEYVREELGPQMVDDKFGFSPDGRFGDRIGNLAAAWLMHDAVFEAYIIMNTDSAAAREANVTEDDLLTPQAARERALAAEYHLDSEIIYLEYSGTFGGDEAVEILDRIDDAISWSRIWYGGGLDNRDDVESVIEAGADTVVVGDIFHDIAALEADLCRQAVDELDPATVERADIREWVEDQIDVSEASATRYLSTIPDLPAPEDRAVRYLAAAVETVLLLSTIADGLEEPGLTAIRERLDETTIPGESDLADVLADPEPMASRIAVSLLAERFDLTTGETAVSKHLAAEIPGPDAYTGRRQP